MKIAMWSGPRNLSTALMYSFAARGDCVVWDEPFYAAYLAETGLEHPMRAEVIAANPASPNAIAAECIGPIPQDQRLFYQKHMTVHMIPGFDRKFMRSLKNAFLIRDPWRVVASYAKKRENPVLADLGFSQQAELFDEACQFLGEIPPVIDSDRIRANPRGALQVLCRALEISYSDKMLTWPAGPKSFDGVWAPHWYGAIHQTTGFAGPEGAPPELPANLARLAESALPNYQRLLKHAI